MDVRELDYATAKEVVEAHHYSGTLPGNCNRNYGVYLADGTLGGVCSYGPAVNRNTRGGVLELRRLVRVPGAEFPLSAFVARTLKALKKQGVSGVVSYADPGQGHHGGIYQATNFLYGQFGGASKTSINGFKTSDGEFVHRRVCNSRYGTSSVSKVLAINPDWTVVKEQAKFLYLMPLCAPKDELTQNLKLTILPYPKPDRGDSSKAERRSSTSEDGGASPTSPLQLSNTEDNMPKVNAFSIEPHGSGYTVTIRAWFGAAEVPESWVDSVLDANPVLRALVHGSVGDAEVVGEAESRDTAPEPAAEERPTRRRQATASTSETTTAEEPALARRRRASAASTSTEPTEEAPARRRRRTSPAEGEQSADPTESAPTAGRRSRRASAGDTAQTAKSPSSDVTDEDLVKGASDAAQAIGPARVMEILEEFGVGTVNELTGEARQEFLVQLDAARDDA